jgi:O-antigen/teichoic acid export membrane protein
MLIRQSAAYALARGVPALINFGALALFTRLLGPDEYGRYALVIAIVVLVHGIGFQWIYHGLLRYRPGFRGDPAVFMATVVACLLGAAAVCAGVLALSLPWLGEVPAGLAATALLLVWSTAWFEVNQQLATARLDALGFGLLTGAKAALALALGAALVGAGLGAEGLLWGLLAALLLPPLAWWKVWRGALPWRLDRRLARRLLAYGLPLTASFALGLTVTFSDRLLIGWLRGAEEAGLYAVGYDLPSQIMGVILMIVTLAAYPLAVHALERGGEETARVQLRKNLTLLAAVVLPAASGLCVLAVPLADLVLGAEFAPAAARLIPWIAAAGLLFSLKAGYFDHAFMLGQHTAGTLWALLAATAVNLALNLWWIPTLGFMGAAYATVAAQGTGLALSALVGRRCFPLPLPLRDLLKIAAADAFMLALLWPLRGATGVGPLSLGVGLGVLGYGAALLVLDPAAIRTRFLRRLLSSRGRRA